MDFRKNASAQSDKNSGKEQMKGKGSDRNLADNMSSKTENDHLDKLKEIELHLEKTHVEEHPVDITEEVMQRITSKKWVPKQSWWDNPFWDQLFNPFPVRYAMILFTGVMVGTAFTWFFLAEIGPTDTSRLAGSISSASGQEISYAYQHSSIKMIPYQIGNLYYLNFVINSPNELHLETSFSTTDFKVAKAEFVMTEGSNSSDYNMGSVNFTATGMNSFQLILEKTTDAQASVTVTALQNQSVIIKKHLTF